MPSYDIEAFIYSLLTDEKFRTQIVAQQELEPKDAIWTDFPSQSNPILLSMFEKRGITKLYAHQKEAIEAALRGDNVVLTTGVASGKSLCYQLPILQNLLISPQSRALLLFPTKALAQDQKLKMQELIQGLIQENPNIPPIFSGIYDGDTEVGARRNIRNKSNLIFSNPDMLHLAILPNHTLWSNFFANLKWIILDEVHIYRGVFGSHFANVIRRLKRICDFYGSSPNFICTSATIANAKELTEILLEEPVHLVDKDYSPHSKRNFFIVNPPIVDYVLGIRRSALMESTILAKRWLQYKGQAILFCGSRRSVEIVYLYLSKDERYKDMIRSYRSGYLAEHRREIEKDFREGKVNLVISTNALELGIDIGGLDAVFMNTYPGTIAATRQQAGRAGRKNNTALAILIAGANPLDQYICQHPEYIFENNPENALISPDHSEILQSQLLCAIQDLALMENEGFGSLGTEHIFPYLQILLQEGKIRKASGRYICAPETYPSAEVSLRNLSSQVEIISDNEVIGTVDSSSALWMVHPKAIYLDKGDTWQVNNLDLEHNKAEVKQVQVNYFTQPTRQTVIECQNLLKKENCGGADKYFGLVTVTTTITGFKKLRFFTQEVIERVDLDLPPTKLETIAWWMGISPEVVNKVKEQSLWNAEPNDYGKNWLEITKVIRKRDGYRCQHCGAIEKDIPHHIHHIIPFRKFDNPEEANKPHNLITLCPKCHRLAELTVQIQNGISATGYLLVNLAPFFLMCDRQDLDVFCEDKSVLTQGNPVILIYDNISGGIGLSRKLYDLHTQLLKAALELVSNCSCKEGCPSCVGPVAENGEGAKAYSFALLKELIESLPHR
ncbi:MAG: DEAD/DEAH box helicase [Candidatus Cloacimonetes bacterium]|jgi:DEAD/DEAH box helicase domain-containing protein|nr:DEAD/DEAH box helicase [Candidatus Cloacimonadota bacterium]